ncbi:LOW QUALITY PROTEIN: leucine-rich repeat-containing protein 71 [Cottoperca gobio]|uniref:LOW QUALITY PROTEIN: leucine-rich repeat-containing protein 71 n=1 Tax=Cottoperca gobio TaxID=56716 RepID=A0A6J2QLE8_COTGO|nr:LOW QUALITY PROTEIN: leucine-rich repeat-containing protein 71 [Cottoperca gobio]
MSRKRQKGKPEKANAEDETSKNTVPTPDEKLSAQTFDEYQCSGNVEVDFPLLCALLDMKDIPTVSTKQPASLTTETEGGDTEDSPSHINAAPSWPKPCLQVELENEDPLSAKNLKLSGWKVDERIARVLQKMLLSLSQLQSLYFWQAGLTDQMLISLMNPISLCSNLRAVTLEGNHLPERSYQLLLSEDSVLAHLSLRNNQMGAEGARVIGSALSTTRSANRNLLSLNLAFNAIGDAGATHIAQGLRLNRALLFLSLSNNQIGDSGAAHLSAILCEFALTHEEVVERRKMLLSASADQLRSVASSSSLSSIKEENKAKKQITSKKDNKPANKDNLKSNKKSSDIKVPLSQCKCGKQGGKEKQLSAQEDKSSNALNEHGESVEIVNPLLDQSVQHRDGELILPGNTTLSSLNLAGNRITEKSLPLFLTSLEMQDEGGGLLRLCLERNRFPPECECYVKIKELMTLADPLKKPSSEQTEEEEQGA